MWGHTERVENTEGGSTEHTLHECDDKNKNFRESFEAFHFVEDIESCPGTRWVVLVYVIT